MNWNRRFLLSGITLFLSLLFGVLGGFLGTRLPMFVAFALPFLLGLLLLPWDAPLSVIPSQENLSEGLDSFLSLSEDMRRRSEAVREMREKLEEGVLSTEELEAARADFDTLRTLEVEQQKLWRELFFPEERRTQIIPLLMVLMAAASGAVLSVTFSKWLL